MPLGSEFFVSQDLLNDAASTGGTHGVLSTDEVTEVVDDNVAEVLGTVVQDIVESTDTLAVETEVLREALGNAHFHLGLLVEEVPDSPGILVGRTGGETLVCGVEEGEELLALAQVSNSLPLLLVWVETGGVMSAGMEEDDVSLLGLGFEGRHHAFEVEGASGGLVVWVGLPGDASKLPDGQVVGPGRVGEPDVLGLHKV